MQRGAGILLPVSSLPSAYGIGCFSKEAYDFVDWLAEAGQSYWQILPLGATSFGGSDDSPYQVTSVFAGNPYFISLDALVEEGVLSREECTVPDFGTVQDRVDYKKLHDHRLPLLRKAYERSDITKDPGFLAFVQENAWWLEDYALFMAVRGFFGEQAFSQWPEDIRRHWGFALDYYRRELYFDVEFQKYLQYKFFCQWSDLKNYANSRGIRILGDLPIYVSPDGADLWANPHLFQLDENQRPTAVAGCPPDRFEPGGQLWGNPLYRWDAHARDGYAWWLSRLWYSFRLYDGVRIDHFRGFDEYFSIPAGAADARNGHWEKGPGMALFHRVRECLGERMILAEDLGFLTDSVRQLVKDSGFPNMKVLQFAFDEDDIAGCNEYLPHHYEKNCVVYTGTHDNETLAGWLEEMTPELKNRLRRYLDCPGADDRLLRRAVLVTAMGCSADTCIIPIQDYLGLDNSCRMNRPATVGINWRWRMSPGALTEELAGSVRDLTLEYGRISSEYYRRKDMEVSK